MRHAITVRNFQCSTFEYMKENFDSTSENG